MIRVALMASSVCCVALAGCAGKPAEQPPRTEPKPSERAAAQEVTLRTVTSKGLSEAIGKHPGKVVLVDFWATWCDPCKKLFPHTVALHRELSGKGLVVISVSFDEVEDEPDVLKFLTAQGAVFENFRAESGASPRSATEFDLENGAIPFVRLYDRSGKLSKTLTAPISAADVEQAVKGLLAQPAST